jgi:drug/metabolite transporter (DMT)-like permease
MSPTRLAVFRLIGAAALFGVSTPLARIFLMDLPPTTVAGLLYLGAALWVAPLVVGRALRREPVFPSDGRNRLLLAGAVFFGGGLAPVLVFSALARSPSSSVSVWLCLETVATAVLGRVFFRENIGRFTASGNALVFGAGLLLAFQGTQAAVLPAVLVAAAALCWGLDNHLTALIDGIRPAESTFFKGLVAGSVNFAAGLFLQGSSTAGPRLDLLAECLLLGALCYGASIVLTIRGAQVLGAVRSQMLFSAAPFFGVAGAIVLLGEGFTMTQGLSLALLALGNGLVAFEHHTHGHIHGAIQHEHEHCHDDLHHAHHAVDPGVAHVHPHRHDPIVHDHLHLPDLHHRHGHGHGD